MPFSFTCGACGKLLHAREELIGKRVKCAGCAATIEVPPPLMEMEEAAFVPQDEPPATAFSFLKTSEPLERAAEESPIAALGLDTDSEDPSAPDPDPVAYRFGLNLPKARPPEPTHEPKVWEYKVLTQKDKWFSGKFDPERLEDALNSYAKQGWRLRGMATATFPGFGGAREELVFVLER